MKLSIILLATCVASSHCKIRGATRVSHIGFVENHNRLRQLSSTPGKGEKAEKAVKEDKEEKDDKVEKEGKGDEEEKEDKVEKEEKG